MPNPLPPSIEARRRAAKVVAGIVADILAGDVAGWIAGAATVVGRHAFGDISCGACGWRACAGDEMETHGIADIVAGTVAGRLYEHVACDLVVLRPGFDDPQVERPWEPFCMDGKGICWLHSDSDAHSDWGIVGQPRETSIEQ